MVKLSLWSIEKCKLFSGSVKLTMHSLSELENNSTDYLVLQSIMQANCTINVTVLYNKYYRVSADLYIIYVSTVGR